MSPEQGQAESGGWTNTLFVVGVGVAVGITLIVALGEANKCPRLRTIYQRALESTGEERKLADFYLDDAKRAGCRWAQRWPFTVEERVRR